MNMEPSQILPAGKERERVQARRLFYYWAVRELGIAMSELSRRLGLSLAGISQSVKCGEKTKGPPERFAKEYQISYLGFEGDQPDGKWSEGKLDHSFYDGETPTRRECKVIILRRRIERFSDKFAIRELHRLRKAGALRDRSVHGEAST